MTQAELYRRRSQRLFQALHDLPEDIVYQTVPEQLSGALTILRQICCHPDCVDDGYVTVHSRRRGALVQSLL